MVIEELDKILKFISKCPADVNWRDMYKREKTVVVGLAYKKVRIPDIKLVSYNPTNPVKIVPNIYKDELGIVSVFYNNQHYKLNQDVPNDKKHDELLFGALPILLSDLKTNNTKE